MNIIMSALSAAQLVKNVLKTLIYAQVVEVIYFIQKDIMSVLIIVQLAHT